MITALWIWWLIEHFTGFRISRFGTTGSDEPISLWYPLISSPLIFVVSIIWWQRSASIAANGVLVDATILLLGFSSGGMRDVTLSYVFNGRSFKVKKSFDESSLTGCEVGDTIRIIADKRNPKRILIHT